ncbi:hypothetical protein [Aestuariivirga litoralis]|uniref:hypothetical protein n=1 Tax=Aestuariivirga litoralis TaxID=2650924 RepID=UPI0018C4E51B|nr:hypothetical protein [Aestuariivirga litoralis]MBG1232973.1 hypothetical protein [Aestuariivirga litoralis]
MTILENAIKRFGALRSADAPEWADENGVVPTIYWKPLTGEEQGKLMRMSKAQEDNAEEYGARLFITKAIDKDGKPLFGVEDMPALLAEVDFTVVNRITSEMLNVLSPKAASKN